MRINLEKESNHLLSFIEMCLTKEPPIKVYNSINSKILKTGYSYEDLGDYLPFLIYFKRINLANKETEKAIKYLIKSKYVYHKSGNLLTRSYDQQDLIFGLLLASQINPELLKETEKTINIWSDIFYNKNLSVASLTKIPFTEINLPKFLRFKIPIVSLEGHGMFIELYTLLYEKTKNKIYLNKAKEIYEELKINSNFKELKFFPFHVPKTFFTKIFFKYYKKLSKKNKEFQLLKQNSNTFLGILRLYLNLEGEEKEILKKEIKEIIDNWIDNYYDKEKGVFYTNYDHNSKKKSANLTCFHIIDILVTLYLILKEKKYLNHAENITDSYIKFQSKKSGLLPFYHPLVDPEIITLNINKGVDWLDCEVDFCISLLRLYQITQKQVYKIVAFRIISGIIKYHKQKFGYAGAVDINTGDIIVPEYSVKNTGLILKIFIAMKETENINKLNNNIYYVLQDR